MSDNIKVVVKVRPLISREIEEKLSYQWRVKNNTLYQLGHNGKDLGQSFTFDKVYDKDTKTSDVYDDIAKPIVEAAAAGFNGTIFAYGQTSSGKTYTMTGTDNSPGIIPLTVLNLFEIIKSEPDRDFLVRVSYIEIYNETVKDLLNVDKEHIKINDTFQGIKVDATERVTSSPEDVLEIMREGEANRQKGATNMNEQSSRSHSIFQIIIESREHTEEEEEAVCVNVSQLNLVDLAGSERSGQTGATGIRFKEGTHINKSLSALALVIKQLSEEPNKYINYRDSKLTRILQNSLGGNAKTSIICAVTPAAVEETISTLQFANRAKAIKNKPEVNAVATDRTMIQDLTKQMCRLKALLESKKNIEQDNYKLQSKIANLQKVILNGFNQRRNIELIGGTRRKLQLPRRVTISTLHPTDDDPVVTVPKFCTPSLKYNPMSVPRPEEFVPLAGGGGQLASVPEEPARLVTPPPTRAVAFSDEVIELDSDDDSTKNDIQTCSPFHTCYKTSKTPPCVLKKKAETAEKDLKDIVELTEREKMFTPSVVEYIEKIERYSNEVVHLQEQIERLTKQGEEKDLELNRLKNQMNKSEEEMKALILSQNELKTQCDNYTTKMIDAEVSYDTLKNKSKLREDELLSLLKELQNKDNKIEDIDKVLIPTLDKDVHFMNMSKDISLVNSDNDSSSVQETNDELDHLHRIVSDPQTELDLKDQNTNLSYQKQISSLENLNQDLQEKLTELNKQFLLMENENSLLKSKIETLNDTINGQKENLETANHDIDSYNSIIQDLQIKLSKKETLPKININDDLLENMIANEERFIANNENIKNIIVSLQNAVDNRNKEIDRLKTIPPQDNSELSITNHTLTEQLKTVELELSSFKDKNTELENINKDNTISLQRLREEINKLTRDMAAKSVIESEISEKTKQLLKHNEELANKISHLEQDITEKDNQILSLKEDDKDTKDNVLIVKSVVCKLHIIASTLTGEMQVMPNFIENVNIFSALSDSVNVLENVANDFVTQKEEVLKTISNLKINLEELTTKYNSEISELQDHINNLNQIVNNSSQEKDLLTKEIQTIRDELDASKSEKESLQNHFEERVKDLNQEREELLNILFRKITEFVNNFNIEHDVKYEMDIDSRQMYERILRKLDKIGNHIIFLNQKNIDADNNLKEILIEYKKEIEDLSKKRDHLLEQLSTFENKNSEMLSEVKRIKDENKLLNKELVRSQGILQGVQVELKSKADELLNMENKVKDWKGQFTDLDKMMKQEMSDLKLDNTNLKARIEALRFEPELNTIIPYEHEDIYSMYNRKGVTKQPSNISITSSPSSLVTICCNKIVDIIQPRETVSSTTTSSPRVSVQSDETYSVKCKCNQLSTELKTAWEENSKTIDDLEQTKSANKNLIHEQLAARSEIQHLIELTQELQKRIVNHKTILSILTTTVYAENMSLKSQVKVIQHHLNRFHNVCRRDLPEFKNQLFELLNLFVDQQNASFKRFSLPDILDSSSIVLSPNFKNESTLDGDLLMLDTNITLTTAADNTLSGHDQTGLDSNRNDNEATCLTKELNQIIHQNAPHLEILNRDNQSMYERINTLKGENEKLRETVDKYTDISMTNTSRSIEKSNDVTEDKVKNHEEFNVLYECNKCKKGDMTEHDKEKLSMELEALKVELQNIKSQKANIEQKYSNLLLETPSTDNLVKKLNTLEKDNKNKIKEIADLAKKLKSVQDENDSLSTQIMEHITEEDYLNNELSNLKQNNNELLQKCSNLEKSIKMLDVKQGPVDTIFSCSECLAKEEIITLMQKRLTLTHKKLDRSLSDSDTLSRYNKICTLQNELHAGREDCKELTEDVVTIKNHLERSNLSMDLDDSIVESNIDTYGSLQSKKCNMRDIPEESQSDNIYARDKIDCYHFYSEKTGEEKGTLNQNVQIIDLMEKLYEFLITKHGKEVENLTNELKDFDDCKNQLQLQYSDLVEKHTQVTAEFKQKDQNYNNVSNALLQIKHNINILNQEIINVTNIDVFKLVNMYEENFSKVLDSEFGLSSMNIFKNLIDNIIKKHESDLTVIIEENTNLKDYVKKATEELNSLNEHFEQLKGQLSAKETEYTLLEKQKDKLHEISSAVTIDIVEKDNKLTETLNKVKELEKEIEILQIRAERLQEINNAITLDLIDKNTKLQAQQECNEDLNKIYESKVKENKANVDLVEKLSEEVKLLYSNLEDKEKSIVNLKKNAQNEKDAVSELLESVKGLKDEITRLKAVNEVITAERNGYAEELLKSGETIKHNIVEMEKMTSDILILKVSGRENEIVIEKLNFEVRNLLKDNMELKRQFDEKFNECCRLETNIKTHEKTAEIQSRMITRLEKQKDTDDTTIREKNKLIEELTHKCAALQKQCEQHPGAENRLEVEQLRMTKETLEARISELEVLLEAKSRLSIDAIADSSRRRRQSLHDSKRMFAEDIHKIEDHNNLEAMFASRHQPDDLFMDVEEDVSLRSSPVRTSKGRDSLSFSRNDQSDKDEEPVSRPSSVMASRRRRQSIHDLHRSVLRHTPSPHGLDLSNRINNEMNHSKPSDTSGGNDSELTQVKERLAICQQELEDLKEKYRELDDECETCSEYLRERDAQCSRLKKEKAALQVIITELKEKINNPSLIQENTTKPSVAHIAVNTDEDWTNLHSVVVDRMSYDAEVEKNKRLTRTIEELRFTKQDLKNTIAKMQNALERNSESRKQDSTKAELQACKQELLQLRERYKDLDEECETCAQYLRDKEQQCRKLKEAKSALEAKLQELQGDHVDVAHSVRKKRQSLHDQNRPATANDTIRDAATETSDDFLSYQVERDGTSRTSEERLNKEIQRLKLVVEKLSQHKVMLEQQLATVTATMHAPLPAMYVATGSAIVQNQQLSDVMKENQKLKKMNAKLVSICKKRGKDSNRENEDPANKD